MEWIVLGVLLVPAVWLGLVAYRLYASRWRASRALDALDRQLKRRHALIPPLVAAASRHAGGDSPPVVAVTQARRAAVSAQGLNQQAASEGVLHAALGRLVGLEETVPALRADAEFQALQNDLARIETGILAARRVFNNAVAAHNAAIDTRSAALVAAPLGYRPLAFFDVGETQRLAHEAAPSPYF